MPTRALTVALLLAGLLVLGVWFGTLQPAPALGDYPDADDLAADYDAYLGEPVAVGGRVVATDPVTIDAFGDDTYVVTDLAIQPDRDDNLYVFAVVRPDATLEATTAYTVPPWGRTYTYVVSALAGLWVLARIVRHWQLERWSLTPRGTPTEDPDA